MGGNPGSETSPMDMETAADGSKFFMLAGNRRVTVRTWKNNVYVDIREFYEENGELKPGKKGISLNVDQYRKLKHMIPTIDAAIDSL